MKITLGSNIASERGIRQLNQTGNSLEQVFLRLSSGQRINRASDDAAGLAIASDLNATARIYNQAVRNVNDGISLLNIADATLGSLKEIVTRQLELAEQAANGTYSFKQRLAMHDEANALVEEFNRIVATTKFNGKSLFEDLDEEIRIQAGIGLEGSIGFNLGDKSARNITSGEYNLSDSLATGTGTTDVQTADLNGDGKVDILAAIAGGGVNVYLGNGDGTFQAQVNYNAGGGQARSVELADMNNDGVLDAVVANTSNVVGVLLGNGDGTFQAALTYSGSSQSYRVELADFDSDGNIDVAVGNSDDTLSIFLGQGNGTLGARTDYAASAQNFFNGDIASGDLDRDGNLDLVMNAFADGVLDVFYGRGDGTFENAVSITATGSAVGVAIADLDNDGYLDLIGSANTFINNGDRTFTLLDSLGLNGSPRSPVVADMNGDGLQDVLGIEYLNNSLSIILTESDGTSGTKLVINGASVTNSDAQAAGDFDGDGVLDVAVAVSGGRIETFLSEITKTVTQQYLQLASQEEARDSLELLKGTLNRLNEGHGQVGSVMSRLEVAASNLKVSALNIKAAEARIMEANYAEETALLTKQSILQRVSQSVLAQANLQPSLALKLLS